MRLAKISSGWHAASLRHFARRLEKRRRHWYLRARRNGYEAGLGEANAVVEKAVTDLELAADKILEEHG